MKNINLITRRGFLSNSFKISAGVALSTLVDIPLVMKRALAEGNIGLNGKKLLFIFLRGGMDGLNTVVPIEDSAYNATNRPDILIPRESGGYYSSPGQCDFPVSSADPSASNYSTFHYNRAIKTGNGFAALHPSLKFLAPVYNAGELAVMHRVGYPKQSRSHFDSQIYWENGSPNNNILKDGIFYRTLIESGLAGMAPLTGVSVQSALPLILRGSGAAMTNLTDPTRYNLLGVPNTTDGNLKAEQALIDSNLFPFPAKKNRDFLALQYKNLTDTLPIFGDIGFTDAGNTFRDDVNTDGDTEPYYLFPTNNAKNGGYTLHGNDSDKYVVDTGAYSFFTNLKAAALILNKTDAIIAGTELGGFDTHNNQGSTTGAHPNLMRRIGWAMYALRKYFINNGDKATWDNLVVVTLSEFGRTTIQNANAGTDHAEASAMFVAGGGIHGGVYGCHPGDPVPWLTGQAGSMFGVSNRYLKRAIDYRSVLGELIREHLGATQSQLGRIIPGYANAGESLFTGGTSSLDGTPIIGEVNVI
ncbi:MAG: DUF1501 domain-containing protein [Verrucomicrobia bacterium]|nr:DUF1501 domain-containing protein [Verrucomicrobiota bacterium]